MFELGRLPGLGLVHQRTIRCSSSVSTQNHSKHFDSLTLFLSLSSGPPPPIQLPPTLSISIPIPLPKWPQYTLPPNGPPTASPKPTDCKTETGEFCIYKTTYTPTTSAGTTTTESQVLSTCATVAGCAVSGTATSTSTTVSSTARPTTYVVYPKDGTDQGQVDSISSQLKQLVSDPSSIYASDTETFGLNYWLLPLDSELANKVEAIADVS
jgi:hypothetical protein